MQTESVDVLSPGTVLDVYSGDETTAWELDEGQDWETEPAERSVTTLAPAEPRPSQEPVQEARNAVTSGWTLYLPAGDAISPRDRVRVRGEVYPVQGEPSDWMGAGVVIQAYRTEG